MSLIPERVFEQFLLTESEPLLPLVHEDVEMDQRFPQISSSQSSQNSQPTPMLGDALNAESVAGSPRQFETLQNCQQPPANQYQNEDSQQSNFEVGLRFKKFKSTRFANF